MNSNVAGVSLIFVGVFLIVVSFLLSSDLFFDYRNKIKNNEIVLDITRKKCEERGGFPIDVPAFKGTYIDCRFPPIVIFNKGE